MKITIIPSRTSLNINSTLLKRLNLIIATLFIINISACSTTSQDISREEKVVKQDQNGKKFVYGSTYGYCKPYPQSKPADIDGVKGAQITNEKYSVRGNKDYKVLGKDYVVWRDLDSYIEEGTASWYGPGFHGQKTSNGEHYNMNGFTAAHKNLPLPSFLKVTNLENGKSVIVRVNDRGPFHGSRILDLSKGAAAHIGVIPKGTAKVRVELVKGKVSSQTTIAEMNGYKPFIQVFSTSSLERAQEIAQDLQTAISENIKIYNKDNIYRVKIGPITQNNSQKVLEKAKQKGYSNAFFVAE